VALSVRARDGAGRSVAIFYSHAHGNEMPDAASAPTYASGLMLVADLPHMVGIALGMLIGRIGAAGSRIAFRLAGRWLRWRELLLTNVT